MLRRAFLGGALGLQLGEDPRRAVLTRFLTEAGAPGATACVISPKGPWLGAAGRSFGPQSFALTPSTPMLMGSIGKTYAAALAIELSTAGALDLDETIQRWLGDRPWFSTLPNHRQLTLRMLLSHTSGLPDHVADPRFIARLVRSPQVAILPEELLAYVAGAPALFPAGQGVAYSDTGYILAGLAIEAATRRRYFSLLRARLLKPLALSETMPARLDLPNLASGRADPRLGLPTNVNPKTEWTGGGLAATASDVARWMRLLATGQAMAKPYTTLLLDGDSFPAVGRFGLGVFVRDTPLGPGVGHAGWFPGYRAIVLHFLDPSVTVSVLTNTSDPNDLYALALELARV